MYLHFKYKTKWNNRHWKPIQWFVCSAFMLLLFFLFESPRCTPNLHDMNDYWWNYISQYKYSSKYFGHHMNPKVHIFNWYKKRDQIDMEVKNIIKWKMSWMNKRMITILLIMSHEDASEWLQRKYLRWYNEIYSRNNCFLK